MLPKNYRLPSNKILPVIKNGEFFPSKNFNIRFLAKKSGGLKIAILIPIRLEKKAAKRNRAKRLLREAIRQHLTQIKTNGEIVVLAKKNIFSISLQDLSKEIRELLNTLNNEKIKE